ncbi:MAG TPA: STAS domain-containing protein [Herpetosiphon sp.]|uniref:Anti-sigma-factor antagonist n=1 Tax=Herpetosiphon aurantiacus (strain ATCC 23779 / DSM 785 / 114-95) TaxID=316274 RepID=A9AXA3_HERA2|nr:STAS domain-containing protein [Herpetosiphon sp.]ABX06823.1 anti-sigma-factor antagonist [Herpetosiphon aurantiacus DSM 785]HBW52828.1 STAS domain-containing protein [Herpetosiphon sp.]
MVMRLQAWLQRLPQQHGVERRQAMLLQHIVLMLILISVIGVITAPLTSGSANQLLLSIVGYSVLGSSSLLVLWRIRFNALQQAILILLSNFLIQLSISFWAIGVYTQAIGFILVSFSMPIVLAGLLRNRRVVLTMTSLSLAIFLLIGLAESRGLAGKLLLPINLQSIIGTFSLLTILQAVIVDRFGSNLRQTLHEALDREVRLNQLRDSLETTVNERTASLSQTLAELEQRELDLQHTLATLQQSKQIFTQLSAPVLPILPRILVIPLVGEVSGERAEAFAENIFNALETNKAHTIILDVSGVTTIDTFIGKALLHIAGTVRFLEVRTILVGLRPEVAETLIALHINFPAIETFANLEQAVLSLINQRRELN